MSGQKTQNGRDDALDLLGLVRRRHLQLLIGTLLGIIAAVVYHFVATPVYESKTEILVMTRNSAADDGAKQNESQGVHQDILATHMELFASNRIIESAVELRELKKIPSVFDSISKGGDPAEFIASHLKVTRGGSGRGKEANIITATYRDISPKDCATILDALVESYQKFLGDTFSNNSSDAVDLITRAKEELAEELNKHDEKYLEFRKNLPIVFSGEEAKNPHQEQLNDLEREVNEIHKTRSEITSRIEVIDEFRAGRGSVKLTDSECLSLLSEDEVGRVKVLFDVSKTDENAKKYQSEQPLRSEAARAEFGRLLELRVKEKTLSAKYGDDHPQVQIARDKIQTMERFMEINKPLLQTEEVDRMKPRDILNTYLASLKNDLLAQSKREEKLAVLAKTEEAAARELIRYELDDKAMNAESRRLNSLYDVIVERLRNMSIEKDFGGYITEVISPAKPQKKPVWPRLSILGALGSVIGLILGVGLALLAELTDTTFRDPSDVQDAMQLPILAHVPKLDLKATADSIFDPSLCSLINPKSRDAEVYRSLRTSVSFTARRDEMKVIQVTSASPGEGKSTTAANMAVSFAQAGHSVLLIDADMRRPRVQKLFALEKDRPGLADVLSESAELFDAIHPDVAPNLNLLAAGAIPHNPAELLSSAKLGNLLNVVETKFDFVIIDTPPVLAVSDPRIVASVVDGVLITVRIVKDGRATAIHCREVLDSVGANLLGVVINAANERVGHYGYSDNVGYGFEYGGDYYEEPEKVGV